MKRAVIIILALVFLGIATSIILLSGDSKDASDETQLSPLEELEEFEANEIEESRESPVIPETKNETMNNGTLNNTENNQTEINMTLNQTGVIDLSALSINLTDEGCTEATNSTNSTCSIGIKGIVKNSGDILIDKGFLIYISDVTDDIVTHIDIPKVESISAGEEKEYSATYSNITKGRYTIQFRIDPLDFVAEKDENNNNVWDTIKVK